MSARGKESAARDRAPRGASRGFTLLEVIVAMAMTAILAASLFAVLQTAYRARETAETALEPVEAVSVALGLVGRDLECALPPKGVLAGPFAGNAIELGSGLPVLELYRAAPLASPLTPFRRAAGVERIALYLTALPGERLPVLVRTTTGNLLAPVETEPEPEVICRHVSGLEVLYFDGTTWLEVWDSTARGDVLPVAVRVALQVTWPERNSRPGVTYRMARTFLLPCREEPLGEEGAR